MKIVTLILPDQLFEKHPALNKNREVILFEEPRYFTDFAFHKKKLILHRASMKAYENLLKNNGYKVIYFSYDQFKDFEQFILKKNIEEIHVTNIWDIKIKKKFNILEKKLKFRFIYYDSPYFLSSEDWLKKTIKPSYFFTHFYIAQRKRLDLLMVDGKPQGGKWSYDPLNRKKLRDYSLIPAFYRPKNNKFVLEAQEYVLNNFSKNPGLVENFFYPINHDQARLWLEDFLEKRLYYFGLYEDWICKEHPVLFHSLLSPLLNIGLLTPKIVIETTIVFVKKNKIPLNSLEGFIRQVIGWREYIFGIYLLEEKNQRTSNFFEHKQTMPNNFWQGTTNVDPVDMTIKKVNNLAYAHHIERLMILGNFMLLCQIKPSDVYKWFMGLFIDAYDWVMVPNVYGMSQYADGGLMVTKPYFSSSNYILKMSDFDKGNWCQIWNGLFWRFIHTNKHKLSKIPRISVMLNILNKMNKKVLKAHLNIGNQYLDKLIK